jgi:mono/diheme cytochrome c family protein
VLRSNRLRSELDEAARAASDGHSHAPASAKTLKNPLQGTAEELAGDRTLNEKNCASCHGPDGKAHTQAAFAMKVRPADLTDHAAHGLTDGEIYWVITRGIKSSGMPGYAAENSERERWEITLYVRQLRPPHKKRRDACVT